MRDEIRAPNGVADIIGDRTAVCQVTHCRNGPVLGMVTDPALVCHDCSSAVTKVSLVVLNMLIMQIHRFESPNNQFSDCVLSHNICYSIANFWSWSKRLGHLP